MYRLTQPNQIHIEHFTASCVFVKHVDKDLSAKQSYFPTQDSLFREKYYRKKKKPVTFLMWDSLNLHLYNLQLMLSPFPPPSSPRASIFYTDTSSFNVIILTW